MGERHIRRHPVRTAPGIAAFLVAAAVAGQAVAAPPAPPKVPATSTAPAKAESVSGQALVRFRPGTPAAYATAAHAKAGARVLRSIGVIGYDLVSFPEHLALDAVLAGYRADPNVAAAEPNFVGRAALDPNDPCVAGSCGPTRQYGVDLTNARAGWDLLPGRFLTAAEKIGSPGVKIAVLDTKVDAANPDFVNAGGGSADIRDGGQLDLAGARDWVPADRQSGWAAYHGTYVAGIAAAAAGNGTHVAGIGYSAHILPLTVVAGDGTTDAASLAEAIVYAHARRARIINLSLGIVSESAAVRDAIVAVSTGPSPALVVAAAGNNTGSAPFYPGSHPEVLSVSGTTDADKRAPCSNYNANVSVSAPAERVVSLAPMPNGIATANCGTSAATPHVSGLAALLLAQNPARSPAQVRSIIERSAEDLGSPGRDVHFGWGRINVERALRHGDGSPLVSVVAATAPKASGGSSTITAVASATAGVVAAQMRFRSPSAEPIALAAADGAFGSASEAIRGVVPVPSSLPSGSHPVWVRAFDGRAWGPYSVGVVVVDRTPPMLTGASATYGVRATGQPVELTFTAKDNVSTTLAYAVQVFAEGTARSLVFQDLRPAVAQGFQRYVWSPGPNVLPGSYTIKIIVGDEAGNGASTLVGTVLA